MGFIGESPSLLVDEIKRAFFSVREVRKVSLSFRGNLVFIWLVSTSFEEAVRQKIFDVEGRLLESLPQFDFDVHILDASDEPEECNFGEMAFEKELSPVAKAV